MTTPDNVIPCVCLTCGIRNDFSNPTGYCQNGHDDWLEYRDVFLEEDASTAPLKRAMKLFCMTKEELREAFVDKSIKRFKIYAYFDLTKKYRQNEEDIEYSNRFKAYIPKIDGFQTENKEFGLKIGDKVKVIAGYNSDIIYTAEILGFNSEGEMYLLWDCYWFPVKIEGRLIEKL